MFGLMQSLEAQGQDAGDVPATLWHSPGTGRCDVDRIPFLSPDMAQFFRSGSLSVAGDGGGREQ